MTAPKKQQAGGDDFAVLLATVRPNTVREMSDEMRTLVQKIKATGKAGSITLTISIKPMDGDVSVLSVNDEIRVKAPEHTRKPALAWPDDDGNLSRSDPNTMPLFDEDLRVPRESSDEDVRTMPDYDARTGEIKEPPTA
jgi:hypothetical protein